MRRKKPLRKPDGPRRIPDIHAPGFVDECRRQSRIVSEADADDFALSPFMDEALDEFLLVSDSELPR